MRISGSPAPSLPPVSHARSTGRPETTFPAEVAQSPAPAETPQSGAPAEAERAHGLVGAAGHSHRSDVAALRQWINHPDLREDLTVPDVSAEHKGNGFAKAVAAYENVMASTAPVVTDPIVTDPVVTDPSPVVTDPIVTDPVVTDPTPVVTDPIVTDPVVTDPSPVVTDPIVTDPVVMDIPPVVTDIAQEA
jgi:hypothetical protein